MLNISFNKFRNIYIFLVFIMIGPQALSQACDEILASQITSTAATCPGNGSITVPEVTGGYFTVEGPGISGFLQQDNPTFESLSAGQFTVKLYCNGSSTPTEFLVDVVDKYKNLDIDLTATMACPGAGNIEATALYGFNEGGPGSSYQYAFWASSEGGANRSNAEVTYASTRIFSGLAEDTYYIRVKDNCGNFTTKSVTLSPASPEARITTNETWTCTPPNLELGVSGTLKAVSDGATLSPSSYSGYTYSVYILGESDDCSAAGAPLFENKAINNDGDLEFTLDATVKKYKIVTKSPCGHQETECHTPIAEPSLNLTTLLTPTCSPEGSARLVAFATANNKYSIDKSNGNITVTGAGSFAAINNSPINNKNSRFTLEDTNSPYELTYTDGCGVTASNTVAFPTAGNEPSPTISQPNYKRSCVEIGETNVTFELDGWIYGLENNNTEYKLIDNETGEVVQTITGLTTVATNDVGFDKVVAGKTYKVQIVPVSGCQSTTTATFTIPNGQGFRYDASHTVTQNCDGVSTSELSLSENGTGRPTYLTTGPNGFSSTDKDNSNLEPGTYSYTISLTNSGCTTEKSGTYEVVPGPVLPEITKTLALSCQAAGGSPLTTGNALIQFTGNGPFVVEYKKDTDASYTAISGTFDAQYYFTNLSSNTTYQFRIIDQCGRSAVQEATIKPLKPNVILNSIEPCVNTAYTLSAQGFDDPTASYAWTKEGDGSFTRSTQDVVFNPFLAANDGTYHLTLTLLNGCVIRESTVTINSTNCNQPLAAGSIGRYVWYDTNKDGIQNEGDTPAKNVLVTLEVFVGATGASQADPNNWTELSSQTTQDNGSYLFENLPSGIYRVKFTEPDGYKLTKNAADGSSNDNDSNANTASGYSAAIAIDASLDASDIGRNNTTIDAGLIVDPALPVTLLSFEAIRENGAVVQLTWATTSETNASHFEILKSDDAKNWQQKGTVPAQRVSHSLKSYYYTDNNSISTAYYRLKMVDLDGTYAYSKIRTVAQESATLLTVYPNPVRDMVYLQGQQNIQKIALIDKNGRVIRTLTSDTSKVRFNLSGEGMGTYFLQVTLQDGSQQIRKIVVTK